MSEFRKEKKNSSRAQATKNHIVKTFLKKMTNTSWNRISVKDLCEDASVTRGTFYQYYDSIIDLMENIESETLTEIQSVFNNSIQLSPSSNVLFTIDIERDYKNIPTPFTVSWFKYCIENKEKMAALLNKEFSDKLFINRVNSIISSYINRFMKTDGLPDDHFRRHYVNMYVSLYTNAFYSWINDEDAAITTPEDIAIVVDSIKVGGIYRARIDRMKLIKDKSKDL